MRIKPVINTILFGGGKEYIGKYILHAFGHRKRIYIEGIGYISVPWAFNANITRRCNSNCEICYEHRRLKFEKSMGREFEPELTIKQWRKIFIKLKKAGVLSVTLTGGEPLKRPEIIRLAREIFGSGVIVITNGALYTSEGKNGLPEDVMSILDAIRVFVSIHHPDPVINDRMSGVPGMTALQDKNIKGKKNIIVSMVLNHENLDGIEAMVEKVKKLGLKIVFSGFTASRRKPGEPLDPLILDAKDSKNIVPRLMKVWEENKDIVLMTPEIIKLFGTKRHQKGCSIREGSTGKGTVLSLNSAGKPIKQCVMGENAACEFCNCIIPMYMETLKWAILLAIVNLDPEIINRTMRWVSDMFSYNPEEGK